MKTIETINKMKESLDFYQTQLRWSEGTLQRCNYIVECGAYTIGADDSNKAVLESKRTPTQWMFVDAKHISEKLDAINTVKCKIYVYVDWYNEKIKTLKFCIEQLEKLNL